MGPPILTLDAHALRQYRLMFRFGVNIDQWQILGYKLYLGWIGSQNFPDRMLLLGTVGTFEVDELHDCYLGISRATDRRRARGAWIPPLCELLIEPGVGALCVGKGPDRSKNQETHYQQIFFHLKSLRCESEFLF